MKAIGIDLGTTNSVAAEDDGEGRLRTLPTTAGEAFTPSVVSFKDGELLVGRRAWNNAAAAPEQTIFSIKRLMGRSFNDENVREVRKTYPYAVEGADDDQGVRVLLNGVKYRPEDISAMILRQVVEDAGRELGETVTHAVITVPAYFNDAQRHATRKAGEQVGVIVKKMIDEPTAAAFAFGFDRQDEAHQLLVFDMGGGTLDVSIGVMAEQHFVGRSHAGDMWLGGDDFDREILEMMIEWVKQHYRVDVSKDRRFLMIARRKAEETKCLLSDLEKVDVVLPAIIPLPRGQAAGVAMTISRSDFNARTQRHVDRGLELVRKAMDQQDIEPDEISAVLLVGGGTRIPRVREALEHLFGRDRLHDQVDPMEAVALGAAILAQQLEGVECPSKDCGRVNSYDAQRCETCGESLATARAIGTVGLYEVTERPLGIGAVEGGKDPDVFSVLIEKGTPYPLEQPVRRRYLTTDRQITIPVYAGDKEKASENEYLGLVEYELPSNVPSRTPVWVQFNYDRDRILTVRVEVEDRPHITYEGTPKRQVLDPNKMSDESWRTGIQNTVKIIEILNQEYGEFIEEEQKEPLAKALDQARQALAQNDRSTGQQVVDELTQIITKLEVASHLFMVDRMMQDADPKTSQWLSVQSKSLRDAYRAGDAHRVIQIRKAVETTFDNISERMARGPSFQKFGGLLEILRDAERAPA